MSINQTFDVAISKTKLFYSPEITVFSILVNESKLLGLAKS